MSARGTRAQGGLELSAKKRSDTEGAGDSRRSKKSAASDRGPRRQRSSDLGRALRSVYDDTLREAVPDDFLNLLGKLS
jgi:Anti-sigma factor NepR